MDSINFVYEKLSNWLPANSLRRRFVRGAFWSIIAAVLAQGMGLLAIIVAGRILGKTGLGELGIIQSTVGMFGVFAGLGLGLTATKHVAEFRRSDPVRAGQIIAMTFVTALFSGGIISAVIFVASPYLAVHTICAPHLIGVLRFSCGLLFCNTLIGAQLGVLSGLEAFRAIAWASLFRGLLNFLLVVLGVYFWGLSGAIGGLVCTVAISLLINSVVLRRETFKAGVPICYHGICSQLPILWKFSIPAFLGNAMVGPVIWGANALLVNQKDGYAELGIFTAAMQFQMVLNRASAKIGAALLPMLASQEAVQSDKFNRANILISWLIGIIPTLPLICFPEIMSVFGPQYTSTSAQRTFVLVVCYTCVMLYKQGLARVLAANGLMWWSFLSNTMWATVLLGSFWFLKRFGAVGLATSFVIAYALNTICFVPLYVSRKLAPKSTLISLEAATVWIVIAVLAGISILQFSLFVRGTALFVSLLPLYIAFKGLFYGRKSK
jgi:O-antigen/teichoic acid export membrane protein